MRFSLRSRALLALGAAMSLVAGVGPAGAFGLGPEYLPAATTDQTSVAVYREGVDAAKVENVWWCRWGRCGGYGYGWHRGWGWGAPVVGGLAAGAIVGGALAAPYYAGPYYPGPYYGGCWRRVWGYYGWRWVRYC